MTIRRHHCIEVVGQHDDDCTCSRSPECRGTIGPIEMWFYEDRENNEHVYFGIRGNPPDSDPSDDPAPVVAE